MGCSILSCGHDLLFLFLKVHLCSQLLKYISLKWAKLIKKSRSLRATVLASLFTILHKSHTLISKGVIFTSESLMQIFNHFKPTTRGILIKTYPLEVSPVMTALRYVSLPVGKLFCLFFDTVQYWTGSLKTPSQTSQESSCIMDERAYIVINHCGACS